MIRLSKEQPFLIASKKTLAALSHGNRTPADLLTVLTSSDILDLLRTSKSAYGEEDVKLSRFYSLDENYLLSADNLNKRNPFAERFLSILSAGRRLVMLEVVESGCVQEATNRCETLIQLMSKFGQSDQSGGNSWTLIIIVKSEVDADDIDALKELNSKIKNGFPLRVYLMDGKLRAASDGYFVQSCNVWVDAIPPLLIYLDETTHANASGGIYVWRSIVLEPTVDTELLLRTFQTWLEDRLYKTDTTFDPPVFSPHDVTPQKINKDCDVSTIRFSAEHKNSRKFEKMVDKLLVTKSIASVRREAANTLRKQVVVQSKGADSDIRNGETMSWLQAHKTPAMMNSMEKALKTQNHSLSQELSTDASSWNTLLQKLNLADTNRDNAIQIAKVIDEARNHFISWLLRITFTLISILVVFYLVGVTLKPILDVFLSSWEFWGTALVGVGGAVAATFVSWNFERAAGDRGTKKLSKSIMYAHKNNATQACLNYIAEKYEKNQKRGWVDLLDTSTSLAKRLSATISYATRGIGEKIWNTIPDGHTDDIYQIDRDKYKEGTCLELGKLTEGEAKQYAQSVLDDSGVTLWYDIVGQWKEITYVCDGEKRGSFPVDKLCRHWGQAVQFAQAKYLRLFLEKAMLKWSKDQAGERCNEIAKDVSNIQGISVSSRPFMSSMMVSSEDAGNSIQTMLVQTEGLKTKLAESMKRQGRLRVKFVICPDLPYYGMFFEEMPIALNKEGDVS